MKRLFAVALCSLVLAGTSCDEPNAGELLVELATPNASDGAIAFRVESSYAVDVTGVTAACTGCQAFMHRVSDSDFYCVVTGPLTSGPLVRLAVSNVVLRSAYKVTIEEIAGLDHRLRSPTGYELRLTR